MTSKTPSDKPTPCEPPPAQCTEMRHIWNTDKKGRIVGDKCRCGKGKPIKRMV